MFLVSVAWGLPVLLLWWRNGRRGALKMRYLYGVRVRLPPGARGLVDLRTFPAGMFPLLACFPAQHRPTLFLWRHCGVV